MRRRRLVRPIARHPSHHHVPGWCKSRSEISEEDKGRRDIGVEQEAKISFRKWWADGRVESEEMQSDDSGPEPERPSGSL